MIKNTQLISTENLREQQALLSSNHKKTSIQSPIFKQLKELQDKKQHVSYCRHCGGTYPGSCFRCD